jgi:hypothetical protein
VRLDDLVVRRDERERFEWEQRPAPPKLNGHAFKVLGDYKEVIVAGRSFHLGACQAEVVRLLHEAAKTEEPWRYGKAVLAAAGSSCTRMADLFKSQQHWRELIASDAAVTTGSPSPSAQAVEPISGNTVAGGSSSPTHPPPYPPLND